ncbi:MAG TPA: recombinase family protein, partial [Calditerricola sp.]
RIYTVEVFLERSQILAHRIEETKAALANAEQELEMERKRIEARSQTIPKVEHVLGVYHQTDDPAKKNALLKSVLEYATYRKEKGGRWSGAMDQFSLTLFPRLPK